jgi:acyl carrier protein
MDELEREIKHLIVESLNLDGVAPDSIDAAAPLFGAGLGLDSIDALELAMALRKKYGVRTTADDARNREIFSSVRSLAAFVLEEQRRALAG